MSGIAPCCRHPDVFTPPPECQRLIERSSLVVVKRAMLTPMSQKKTNS